MDHATALNALHDLSQRHKEYPHNLMLSVQALDCNPQPLNTHPQEESKFGGPPLEQQPALRRVLAERQRSLNAISRHGRRYLSSIGP